MKLLPAIFIFSVFFPGLAEASDITLNPSGNNDQNQISEAIKTVSESGGGTVFLNPGNYDISNPVIMKSNVKLTGNHDTVFTVSASYQWFTGQNGVISNPDESLHDVEICNFRINGNIGNLPRTWDSTPTHDRDAEKLILIGGWSSNFGSNISVHDMILHDSFSDVIYIRFTDGVYIYNNIISDAQHEGFYLSSCRTGLIYNNSIAGITSDCGRLDNSQDFKVYDNTFFSYDGNSFGAYKHGENGLQVGDQGSGVNHGFTASKKPFTTKNIEVTNNVFANNGLKAILLDNVELGSQANIYIHDNKFLNAAELKTSGVSFELANGTMPTLQQSEQIFSSIFDILNLKFADSGYTNQTSDSIQYIVQQTEQGAIAGGIKIVGFSNVVSIDGKSYIPDNNSILVKYAAVKAPSFSFVSGGVSSIKPTVNTSIINGTAFATLTVKMEYYTVSTNQKTNKTTKKYHIAIATFNDSCKSPDILERPKNITGTIYQYPTFFMVSVPSDGFTRVSYEYAGNYTNHTYFVGSRNYTSYNIELTEFSKLEFWDGNLQHSGNWLYVLGEFDRSKLSVIALTPYETQTVSEFNIKKLDFPKTIIANWFYPELAFLAISFIFGKWLFNQIKYR